MKKGIPPRAAALICWIMTIGAFILAGISLANGAMGSLFVAVLMIALFMVVLPKIFWRCPHCGANLPTSGMLRIKICPYCGKPLL